MTQRYFIQATTLAAQGFCAAAGGATFTPPPRSNSKSISYKRIAQHSDGTLRSRKDCGVPFCMPLYGLQNLDGGVKPNFVIVTNLRRGLKKAFVMITNP